MNYDVDVDSIGPGVRYTLAANDRFFAYPNVIIHSTDNSALNVAGASVGITIGGATTISSGAPTSAINSTVAAHSLVLQVVGTIRNGNPNGKAISLSGSDNHIELVSGGGFTGTIFADAIGIWLNGDNAASTTLIKNAGIIMSDYTGIQRDGAEDVRIVNTGVISGAYGNPASGAYTDYHGGVDTIINSGLINGDIRFGGGNDVYLGATGEQQGIVYGYDGNDIATGGAGVERFDGGNQHDKLTGNGGNDFLKGDAGNDKLYGGVGQDKLWGGAGADIFIFNSPVAGSNRDIIYDFNRFDDTMQLENAYFRQAGPVGTLSAAAFRLGTKATDASDRIIYHQASGSLWYDPDGNGAAAKILFGVLAGDPLVTRFDFHVI